MSKRTNIVGELSIEHERGVIYFFASAEECQKNGHQPTPLRIQGVRLDFDVKQRQIDIRHDETSFDNPETPQYGLSGAADKGKKVAPTRTHDGQYDYAFNNFADVQRTVESFFTDDEGDDMSRPWGMLRGILRLIERTENNGN
jgi:hypothetical protein